MGAYEACTGDHGIEECVQDLQHVRLYRDHMQMLSALLTSHLQDQAEILGLEAGSGFKMSRTLGGMAISHERFWPFQINDVGCCRDPRSWHGVHRRGTIRRAEYHSALIIVKFRCTYPTCDGPCSTSNTTSQTASMWRLRKQSVHKVPMHGA